MLKVGIAGIGFMGWIHWLAYQRNENVQVAAICTPEPERRAGDWTKIQGNFGPPGQQVDLTGVTAYENLDDMLNDSSLDVIDICLPPSMHADVICRAAAAGKHVFSEKPLALNLADCDRAVEACKSASKLLIVGQVLPFFPEFKFARDTIASGKYGQLLGGNFKRVIADPAWLTGFYDPNKIGGPLFDLHVHDAHFIRLLFGMPKGLISRGRVRGEVVDYCQTLFDYGTGGPVVSCTSGVINQQARPFTHGFEIHLEHCTMQFEYAGLNDKDDLMSLKILLTDGNVIRPDLGDGDPVNGFVAEMQHAAECFETGTPSEILSGALARDAIELCAMQATSVLENRAVTIEPTPNKEPNIKV